MISSERSQNVIMVITLIIGILSGVSLAGSSAYYSGSYLMIQYLEVDLINVRVNNLQPENETVNPGLSVSFNMQVPDTLSGDASVTFLRASIYLNGEDFDYASFTKRLSVENRELKPGYNRNYTIGSTIEVASDKELLYNAYDESNWTFSIVLTIFYHTFDSDASQVRVVSFSRVGVDIVEPLQFSFSSKNGLQ
ncbi:MAG: hypothetical protein KGY80_05775 [Candidatus Thorarchaeota archaeon]|nr:hypothetical protein [Candidatus Thorarchaeota archaeon]